MRIVLALRDPLPREEFRLHFESERSDWSVFPCGDGRSALRAIESLTPEVAVMDQVLPLLDGPALLAALAQACLPCPPRTIVLSAPGENREAFSSMGVDECLPAGPDADTLLHAVYRAADKLQGALAELSSLRRRELIEAFFLELGMPGSLKGRLYLALLMEIIVPSPYLADALTTRLYPAVSRRFSTTPQAVERCARHAIEATWNRGDMAALERLFGLSVDPDRGKPTNREFLAMAAQHLRQRMRE